MDLFFPFFLLKSPTLPWSAKCHCWPAGNCFHSKVNPDHKKTKNKLHHGRWPPRVLFLAMTQIKEIPASPAGFVVVSPSLSPLTANVLPAGGRSSHLIAHTFLKRLLFVSIALHPPPPAEICLDGGEGGRSFAGDKQLKRKNWEYLTLCCSCFISAEIWLIW